MEAASGAVTAGRRSAGRPADGGRDVDLLGLRAARRTARAARPRRRRARAVRGASGRTRRRPAVRRRARGSSSLIARGVLNLTHRYGHDRVVPLVPGETVTVRVPMQSTPALPSGTCSGSRSRRRTGRGRAVARPGRADVTGGRLELPVRRGPDGALARSSAGVRARAGGGDARSRADGSHGGARLRGRHSRGQFAWIDARSLFTEARPSSPSPTWSAIGWSRATRCRPRRRARSGRARAASGAPACRCAARWRAIGRFLVTTELDAYKGATRCFARRWTHGSRGRRMSGRTNPWPGRRPRDRAPGARAHLPARLAVRGVARRADRALAASPPRTSAGCLSGAHEHSRRRAARVRQRLPPPRLGRRVRGGRARDAAASRRRLDLRPRRRPARRAADRARNSTRARTGWRRGGGPYVGAVRVRRP